MQRTFLPLQLLGRTYPFGGWPGRAEPYGYATVADDGAWYTVVNPGQAIAQVRLPAFSPDLVPLVDGRVQFSDSGFRVRLKDEMLAMGPEQMALVGYGRFASQEHDFGEQADVRIPSTISKLETSPVLEQNGEVTVTLQAPNEGGLRVILRQIQPNGIALRSIDSGVSNAPRKLAIAARQDGKPLTVELRFDRYAWAGVSWLVGEIKAGSYRQGKEIKVTGYSIESRERQLTMEIYGIQYI